MSIGLPISHIVTLNNMVDIVHQINPMVLQYRERGEPLPAVLQHKMCTFHDSRPMLSEDFRTQQTDKLFEWILKLPWYQHIREYSVNLAPACKQVKVRDAQYVCDSPIMAPDELMEELINTTCWLTEFFNTISLENTNYYPMPAYTTICDPEFISHAIRELGPKVFFTLDIGHAIVSAGNLKMGILEYIGKLPLERCSEIHLGDPVYDNNWGYWRDAHAFPTTTISILRELWDKLYYEPLVIIEHYESLDAIERAYRMLRNTITFDN